MNNYPLKPTPQRKAQWVRMLQRLGHGLSFKEIAQEFRTTEQVIKNNVKGARTWLGAKNTVQAVVIALEKKLIKLESSPSGSGNLPDTDLILSDEKLGVGDALKSQL